MGNMMTDGVIGSCHNKNNNLIEIEIKKERAEVASDSVGSQVAVGEVAVGLPQCIQLRGPRKGVSGSGRKYRKCRKGRGVSPYTYPPFNGCFASK